MMNKFRYNGLAHDLVKRFQHAFDEMKAVYNMEIGHEFEIAICDVLQRFLPARARVCRGYVVGANGDVAGDDIIIFDAGRFSALRSQGGDFTKKEHIPAEVVLAYIEAKHTLYIGGDSGQTLERACEQAGQPKTISRKPVSLNEVLPGFILNQQVNTSPAYPNIRNPWYTSVFARYLKIDKSFRATADFDSPNHQETTEQWALRNAFHKKFVPTATHPLPDTIVAGDIFLCPCHYNDDAATLYRFLTPSTKHMLIPAPNVALGLATLHLLWALEWIVLGEIPWSEMFTELGAWAQSESGIQFGK